MSLSDIAILQHLGGLNTGQLESLYHARKRQLLPATSELSRPSKDPKTRAAGQGFW